MIRGRLHRDARRMKKQCTNISEHCYWHCRL